MNHVVSHVISHFVLCPVPHFGVIGTSGGELGSPARTACHLRHDNANVRGSARPSKDADLAERVTNWVDVTIGPFLYPLEAFDRRLAGLDESSRDVPPSADVQPWQPFYALSEPSPERPGTHAQ